MKILSKLFHFIIGILVSLILFEIFLISSEICLPRKGFKSKSGIPAFLPNRNIFLIKEGYCMSRTNTNGLLGDDVELTKSKNQFRIAIIGDSYIEGFQVFPKYHFSYRLKSELLKRYSHLEIQILNFGISGLNFGDMLEKYLIALKYQPDLVFFFLQGKDFNGLDTSRISKIMNYFESESIEQGNRSSFIKDLGLYSLAGNVYSLFKSNPKEAYQILFDQCSTFFELEKKSRQVETTLITNSSGISRVLSEIRLRKRGTIYFVEINEFDESIKNLVVSHDLKVLSLSEVYQRVKSQGYDPFYWKSINGKAHWNHICHQELGKYLTDFIVENNELR